MTRPDTNLSSSTAAILAAPGGPTLRDLDFWVRRGWLHPDTVPDRPGRAGWTWPASEQRKAVAMARLVAAGLRPDAAGPVAEKVVGGRRPAGGPVVLGPGVILSVFPIRVGIAAASADRPAVAS